MSKSVSKSVSKSGINWNGIEMTASQLRWQVRDQITKQVWSQLLEPLHDEGV